MVHVWINLQPFFVPHKTMNVDPEQANAATFRFYGELNDFLEEEYRQLPYHYSFSNKPAVKDAIEAIGVPHPEVHLILMDGESCDFSQPLLGGARVSVFPRFHELEVSAVSKVQPQQLQEHRFILDTHLGRLAGLLRMLGFDAQYGVDAEDERLAKISKEKGRILLTKDRGLLKRGIVAHGYCVRDQDPFQQVIEVLRHFELGDEVNPYSRCIRCNGQLKEVSKLDVEDAVPAAAWSNYDRFQLCNRCGKVYWEGSHVKKMDQLIDRIIASII